VDLWPGATGLFVAKPLHPSFRDDAGLRANWNTIIPQILPHVTSEAAPDLTPYVGNTFQKADLETPPARFPVWRTEVDGNRRHGVANLADADRVERARGGGVAVRSPAYELDLLRAAGLN
jgi:hypothetical protein